jgi:hypothetical protein
MKKLAVTALALASMLASASAQTDLFSMIQNWVGTGANEAAMEIDWNAGVPGDAMVWGYRFNGAATGEQMLDAIVAADPRLYAEVNGFNTGSGLGSALFGLGYHASGDQNFQLSPTLSFNSQHLAYAASYGDVDGSRTAVDAGDLWAEGWTSPGYWAYYTSTDSKLLTTDSITTWNSQWAYSGVGMSSRNLANGSVDGWDFSFYNGTGDAKPTIPIAASPVPEPSTWAMLSMGGVLVFFIHKRYAFKRA